MSEVLLVLALMAAIVFWFQKRSAKKALESLERAKRDQTQAADTELAAVRDGYETRIKDFNDKINQLGQEVQSLAPYANVRDTAAECERIRQESRDLQRNATLSAAQIVATANEEATKIRAAAKIETEDLKKLLTLDAKNKRDRAEQELAEANRRATQVINDAKKRAEEIAGDALRALQDAEALQATAAAMKNVIEGYGDRYLKPSYSLLDELADAYSFDDAGKALKDARESSRILIEHNRAAACDYVEALRRETAIHFVEDAFNGKVDSILSRMKSDNYGTLEQQIRDAFALVNHNGTAFRNARITQEFLDSRINELKWAVAVQALKDRDKEEQRRLREQIREEERAQREIEKALKEAAKEEQALQKALEKVQAQVAKANDEQRAAFEAQVQQLQSQLAEAEARNRRALSMAQQTKAGHVYVISNIGSFGEEVVKVGMTRRLDPLDRVKELGDASVPFAFDVHAMIWADDAPKLEKDLHRFFVLNQMNKANPRKEFFRLSLTQLKDHITSLGIDASWTINAAAAEYRETLAIEEKIAKDNSAKEEWLRHQYIEAAVQERHDRDLELSAAA